MSEELQGRVGQDFCDWCDADDVEITHVVDLDRFSFNAWFCSRNCAEEWGCAADQDKIREVPQEDLAE